VYICIIFTVIKLRRDEMGGHVTHMDSIDKCMKNFSSERNSSKGSDRLGGVGVDVRIIRIK
jgi:hypothetical protein